MKYLVTKKWVVEVTDADVKKLSEATGRKLDPRAIAINKAVERFVELLNNALEDPTTTDEVAFDVEPWKGDVQ
ncbi:MAG TPA: hypothetical protein VN025_05880 [Candidatus Dormibacteraeota bacterium]|jgi:hypothetical protein|nr:hypothetical protein [Candidatus Dormibacteraeota bacterium]